MYVCIKMQKSVHISKCTLASFAIVQVYMYVHTWCMNSASPM